jgi:hypothetical protein
MLCERGERGKRSEEEMVRSGNTATKIKRPAGINNGP